MLTNYFISISIVLLFHQSNSCPLPSNASCNDCDVLRYIQFNPSRQSNLNLSMNLNLNESENTAYNFAPKINSPENEHYTFEGTPLPNQIRCSNSSTEGSPCSDYIKMANHSLPTNTCTWNYTCDYSPRRFPQYLWTAQCAPPPTGYRAQKVYYEIPTLTFVGEEIGSECLPFRHPEATYKWKLHEIVVACICVPKDL